MDFQKRTSSVIQVRELTQSSDQKEKNLRTIKKSGFLQRSVEVSPQNGNDISDDQYVLWQKRQIKVKRFKQKKQDQHKNLHLSSQSDTKTNEIMYTQEFLPTLERMNKFEMPRFTKQRLKLPKPDFNQYIVFDKNRSKIKPNSQNNIYQTSPELEDFQIINKLDQRRQKIIVDNIYEQIIEKYDGLSRKNNNFVSSRFQENIKKNLQKFQPSNSSFNPDAKFMLNYKILGQHKNSTESSIFNSNDSVIHSPIRNIRSKYLQHQYKKRLGGEFEKSQKLLDFIANTYTQEKLDSSIQMKQIDKYKLNMDTHLLDTQWILREDEYDYDRQVSYSFKVNEQKETLKEVKTHILSQMPVNQYKGIMIKGLSKHTKRFIQDRMQKYFPVEDIQKYLYKIQE